MQAKGILHNVWPFLVLHQISTLREFLFTLERGKPSGVNMVLILWINLSASPWKENKGDRLSWEEAAE